MKNRVLAASIAALLCAAVDVSPATAATGLFIDGAQAAGVCQPAREYPDLRVRQKEIDNIGTTNAYVVCSPMVHVLGGQLGGIGITFYNSGNTPKTIRCTMQNDYLGSGYSVSSIVREVSVGADDTDGINFDEDDFNNPELQMPGVQCILPAGTSLAFVAIRYSELDIDN
jgi:hypothetical protein